MSQSKQSVAKLHKQIKIAERKQAEAKGSLDTLLLQLQEEFGIDSIEQAERELKKARARLKQLRAEVDDLQEKFNNDWKEVLDDDD